MGVICIILAVLCLLYYIVVVSYAGAGSTFVWFWLAAFAGFLGLAFLFYLNIRFHFFRKIPRPIMVAAVVPVSAGALLFCSLFGCVASKMMSKPKQPVEYVIVLGAQIRGTYITKSLRFRLDRALEYYQQNEESGLKIIVSGGKGEGEDCAESLVMKQYLVEMGVPENRILTEDKSTTTKENLEFSYAIICAQGNPDSSIAVCSNNFHIFRATALAKHLGMKNVEGLAADCDILLLPNYMVRDSLAIFKEFLLGNLG